jgi:hypothetical protein
LRPLWADSFASLAFRSATKRSEVAHSLHSVRSLGVFLKIFLPYDLLMTGHSFT